MAGGGLPDATNIGQEKPIQNPADAVEREGGTYKDAVDGMSEEQKLHTGIMPRAPDPQPFKG